MMTNNSRGDRTFACQINMTGGAYLALQMAAAAMGRERAHPIPNRDGTGLSGRTAARRNNGGLS
jgi:hypothetical protein